MNILSQLVTALLEHLKHVPSELAIEGVKHLRERRAEKLAETSSLSDVLQSLAESHKTQAGVPPTEEGKCPEGYPIKVSAKNIYHAPGGRFYVVTRPVRCFATEVEAKAAGFRPSLR